MLTTTKTGSMKEDHDVELELGLSLGGGSSKKPSPIVRNEKGIEKAQSFDRLTKREVHALRRQEAKRKREEKKLLQRNRVFSMNGEVVRECKRNKIELEEDNKNKNGINLNLTVEENNNVNVVKNVNVNMPLPLPYVYQNHNLFMNGLAYNANVACWVPVTGYEGKGNLLGGGGGGGGGLSNVVNVPGVLMNGKTMMSYASPIRTSSLGSDNRSTSHEAGGSSDTKRFYTLPEQNQLNSSIEHSASSYLTEISRASDESRNSTENIVQSDAAQSNPSHPKEESATDNNIPVTTQKAVPNPTGNNTSQESRPLPYLPCVSTTGNGPDGKIVKGFLYRYTKTDVSIVCVCHGTSFSPAEFVQHAGGTNITNPLKHITVAPSAFQ